MYIRDIGLFFLFIGILVINLSCFEEEKPIEPHTGEILQLNFDIEHYRCFFDLETREVVKYIPVNSWQLAFDCKPDGDKILVNSGNYWFAANTGKHDFSGSLPTPGALTWKFDIQSRFPDSTAIGNWRDFNTRLSKNEIYCIGQLDGNSYINIYTVQFLGVNESGYTLRIKNEKGIDTSLLIVKDDTSLFTYLSLPDMAQVALEPSIFKWDLLFEPYYDTVTALNVSKPYLVRGCLSNYGNTKVFLETSLAFGSIDRNNLTDIEFSLRRDKIGFNWKDPIINTTTGNAEYIVHSNYTYVIRTQEGNDFKLRFWGFSKNGKSGFPSFELEALK